MNSQAEQVSSQAGGLAIRGQRGPRSRPMQTGGLARPPQGSGDPVGPRNNSSSTSYSSKSDQPKRILLNPLQ